MTGVRITAGDLRGRRLAVPSTGVRPTSEKARQAFFNIVGSDIVDARFLDLFAGSGIFAFEAVSRGAAEAVAVDTNRRALAAIRTAAAEWRVSVRTVDADAIEYLGSEGAADIVYADPPYDYEQYAELLDALDAAPSRPRLVAIEHRRHTEPFTGVSLNRLTSLRRGEYGEVWISLFAESTGEAD